VPRPCRGLGPVALSQTVKVAVSDASGYGTKSRRRHLAIQAYRRLAVLSAAADRAAAAQRAARARRRAAHPAAPPARAAEPLRVPAGGAALAAWLLAAASGALLVVRRRARRPWRSLPPVLVAHLGCALTGLAVWAAYLATGWVPLAWVALGVLLPVAGLGMATLLLAIPDPRPDRSPGPVGAPRSRSAASDGSGGISAPTRSTATAARPAATASAARPAVIASARRPRPARPPVLLIALHGALATLTILAALLGAVAAVAAH
jgi:hypothetical protein